MGFSKLFIDRPILAGVISVMIMLVGAVAYFALPVSQYPEVAPPSITVTASYPGANAETAAATVAAPLEQEINGVERHAVSLLAIDGRRPHDDYRDLRARHRPRRRAGPGPEPRQHRVAATARRSAAARRRHQQEHAGHLDGGAHLLARQLARSAVSVELHAAQHPRPAGQARGRRRSPAVRRARILDAGLARSESDFRARPDRRRSGAGASRSERAGRRRRAGSSTVDATRRLRSRRPAPRAPHRPGAVRRRADQERRRRPTGTRA